MASAARWVEATSSPPSTAVTAVVSIKRILSRSISFITSVGSIDTTASRAIGARQ